MEISLADILSKSNNKNVQHGSTSANFITIVYIHTIHRITKVRGGELMKFTAKKVETVATTRITDTMGPWKESKLQCL